MRTGLLVLLLGVAASAQQVTPVQVPADARVADAVLADVNGDGLRDLVVSAAESERSLRIHLRRKAGAAFAVEPDYTLKPVWTDVVAFAVADVHADEGAEVVLFSAKAAWVWRPRAGERERAAKLLDCSFLWQLPHGGALGWQAGARDLNGDGLTDLLIPEPAGYRVALQGPKGQFKNSQLLVVPSGPDSSVSPTISFRMRTRRMRGQLNLRFTVDGEESESAQRARLPLLEVADAVPAPQLRDWDADGDLDLLVRTERWLFVWIQGADGRFGSRPGVSLEMPVREDRARKLEVNYSAHVVDFDKDRRADCVIFSGDRRSDDVRTQVQFFKQAGKQELFAEGVPDQLLVLAGFAGDPHFADVDGNGYPDLVVGAVRPDLLDTLRGTSTRIDAELYVFLNRKGRLSRRPDLAFKTQVEALGLRMSRRSVMGRFFFDVNGDGLLDMLLRDEDERIRVYATRRAKRGLSLGTKPFWELRIASNAQMRVVDEGILILEGSQVLLVEFP